MSNYLNSCKDTNPLDQLAQQMATCRWPNKPASGTLMSLLRIWIQRHQQRQNLSALSTRMLQDIGITRAQALAEARKPFWVE